MAVPEPIRQYIDEVKTQLQMLTNYNGPSMTLKEKWEFIKLTRHAFGRTALVLSGGGALGAFHLVWLPPYGGFLKLAHVPAVARLWQKHLVSEPKPCMSLAACGCLPVV